MSILKLAIIVLAIAAGWINPVSAQIGRCETWEDVRSAFQPARQWNNNFFNYSKDKRITQELDDFFVRAVQEINPHQHDPNMKVACSLLAKFYDDFKKMRAKACQTKLNELEQGCPRTSRDIDRQACIGINMESAGCLTPSQSSQLRQLLMRQ